MWTRPETVEPEAMRQLANISALPWTFKHVAVMPAVHYGKGATVGSIIAMRDAVSPAAVGVDLGCGMSAVPVELTAADLPAAWLLREVVAHLRHVDQPGRPHS